ncbi:hypothetical protein BJ138DRAFT_1165880 [Hygrophoropsis aurantiaca]|uniref:Uncharacterized protein n=1 Tax=Hygrophoropsis aurantiaca TaxID=72124 RepID=A0ACB7ZUT8_9AGAM|nr:hypothetical protein BJ138DRAFT_1165880 [Hygrophoropsis aurantiaca]
MASHPQDHSYGYKISPQFSLDDNTPHTAYSRAYITLYIMAHQAFPGHVFHIDDWLQHRLENVVSARHHLRFEHSFYGPLNGILQIYFPLSQRFMVKPQGVLQPDATATNAGATAAGAEVQQIQEAQETDFQADEGLEELELFPDDHAGNVSIGSYTEELLPPSPNPSGQRFPDFIIVKAGEGGVMHNDTLLLLVEVKKTGHRITTSRFQIQSYLMNCAGKSRLPNLHGLLVVGDIVEVFFLDGLGTDAIVRDVPGSMLTGGQQMKDFLRELSLANWNI